MAGNPTLFTPRLPIFGSRGLLFTPGFTPIPRLRRVTEDRSPRRLETAGNYRVSEQDTVLS